MEQELQPELIWYKTRAGIIMLSITGLILVIFMLFGILVGYYLIQVRFLGNQANIEQNLSEKLLQSQKFTRAVSEKLGKNTPQNISTASLIHSYTPRYGSEAAPIEIVMFIDFECPYCQESYPIVKKIIQKYDNAVTVVFKHFPIAEIHPDAISAAIAAQCAGEQHKFWEFYNYLFEKKDLSADAYRAYAIDLALDLNAFNACQNNPQTREYIEQDMADGVALGIGGTPTYILNGTKIEGVLTADIWDSLIVSKLQSL